MDIVIDTSVVSLLHEPAAGRAFRDGLGREDRVLVPVEVAAEYLDVPEYIGERASKLEGVLAPMKHRVVGVPTVGELIPVELRAAGRVTRLRASVDDPNDISTWIRLAKNPKTQPRLSEDIGAFLRKSDTFSHDRSARTWFSENYPLTPRSLELSLCERVAEPAGDVRQGDCGA